MTAEVLLMGFVGAFSMILRVLDTQKGLPSLPFVVIVHR